MLRDPCTVISYSQAHRKPCISRFRFRSATGVPGCADLRPQIALAAITPLTDAPPIDLNRFTRTATRYSTRSLQVRTRHNRATACTTCPISIPLAPPHTSRAANSPTHPPPVASRLINSSSTGTTPHHTPQPTLHNHQSLPHQHGAHTPHTNTQPANPTTPLKPVRTGRFSPPDPNTASNYR